MTEAPPAPGLAPDKVAELTHYRNQAILARREAAAAANHDHDCAAAYRAMRAATGLSQHVLMQLGFPPPPAEVWALRPL